MLPRNNNHHAHDVQYFCPLLEGGQSMQPAASSLRCAGLVPVHNISAAFSNQPVLMYRGLHVASALKAVLAGIGSCSLSCAGMACSDWEIG